MDHLPKETIQTIERLHSMWIDLEWLGKHTACWLSALRTRITSSGRAVGLWPRCGSRALVEGTAQIHSIEISHRHLSGSSESVSLTANYRTMFSAAGDSAPREATGSHRGGLRKQAGQWLVFLVSWSSSATTDHLISAPAPRARRS
jgi:hypothetical protein